MMLLKIVVGLMKIICSLNSVHLMTVLHQVFRLNKRQKRPAPSLQCVEWQIIIIVIKGKVAVCSRPRRRRFSRWKSKGCRRRNNEGSSGEKVTEDCSSSLEQKEASSVNELGLSPAYNTHLPAISSTLAHYFESFHCHCCFGFIKLF